MQKRILFPLIWVAVELVVFVLPFMFPIVYVFSLPSMLIINEVSRAFGGPRDTTYIVIGGAILQAFLIGIVWDLIAARKNGTSTT